MQTIVKDDQLIIKNRAINKEMVVDLNTIAPLFDINTNYFNNNYVRYENKLYRFITNHLAGDWNTAEVVEVGLATEIAALKQSMGEIGTVGQLNARVDLTSTITPLVGGVRDEDGIITINSAATSYFYAVIPVEYNMYDFKLRVYGNSYPYYVYGTDDNNNVVQSEVKKASSGIVTETYRIIPSDGVTKFYIMWYQFNYPDTYSIVGYNPKTSLANRLGAIHKQYLDITPVEKLSGLLTMVNNTLNIAASTVYMYTIVNVSPEDVLKIHTQISTNINAYPYYAYAVDDNFAVKDTFCAATGVAGWYEFDIVIPAETTKLYIMYHGASQTVQIEKLIGYTDLQTQIDDHYNNSNEISKAGLPKARWLALGDSITQGYYSYWIDATTYSNKAPNALSINWAKIVAATRNLDLDNRAISGSGWLDKGSSTNVRLNAREQIDDSTIDFTQYDLITLAWGVNDWKGSDAFGETSDNPESGDTVASNIKYVIESIMSKNPECKIIAISPTNCCLHGDIDNNWGISYKINNKTLEDLFELEQQIFEYYGIEFIDMLHSSVINRQNIQTLLIDKVHPSLKAHELLGRELSQKINFN